MTCFFSLFWTTSFNIWRTWWIKYCFSELLNGLATSAFASTRHFGRSLRAEQEYINDERETSWLMEIKFTLTNTWCRRSLFSAADFLFPHSMSFNCRFAFDMVIGESFFTGFLICSLWHVTILIGYCQPSLLAFVLPLIWWKNSGLEICYLWHLFNWLLTILLAHLSNLFGDRVDLKNKLL